MLDSIILEKITSPNDEEIFLALKKICGLSEITFDEAEALSPLLVPYLKSKNPILNTYAKEAFNRIKRLQPKVQIPPELFDSSFGLAKKKQELAEEAPQQKSSPTHKPFQEASTFPAQSATPSTEPKSKLFCEIAMDLEFVSRAHVDKALMDQKVDRELGQNKPIGAYLFAAGAISKEQIEKVLRVQEKYGFLKTLPPGPNAFPGRSGGEEIGEFLSNLSSKLLSGINSLSGNQQRSNANSHLEDSFTFNLWASLGLLISFFLPWGTFLFYSISGYSLSQLGSYGNLAWLIPIGSCSSIYFSINKKPEVLLTGALSGICPLAFLGYGLNEMGDKIFHFFGIGAYLSIILGIALVVHNLPKLIQPSN